MKFQGTSNLPEKSNWDVLDSEASNKQEARLVTIHLLSFVWLDGQNKIGKQVGLDFFKFILALI